jgi:arylsulfatase A
MVRWPGQVAAGKTCHELVSQIDLMATLASVVGHDLPATAAEDSHDLLPLWKGTTEISPRQTHIHNTFENAYAIRHDDWILVQRQNGYHSKGYQSWEKKHQYPANDKTETQLFHASEDREQKNNLIAKHPEKAQQLAALMKKIRMQGHSSPRLANRSEKTGEAASVR